MTLIYTDRSRQELGLQVCERARYWRYHSVNGYGIDHVKEKIHLLTGIAVHEILAFILTVVKTFSPTQAESLVPSLQDVRSVSRGHIRNYVQEVIRRYEQDVRANGFYGIEDELTQELMLKEQLYTIAGLVWGWVKVMLPVVLRDFEIVEVEREEGLVLGCTCGKGKADWTEHKAEACFGVLQQSRPDIVLRHRASGALGIHDFKTAKRYDPRSVDRYRDSPQMAVGTAGVERRLGQPITHYYVHFLVKGEARGGYVKATKDFSGPMQLQNSFCYVDYTPPQPPMVKEQIGTVGTWYTKTPVWLIDFAATGKPEGISNVEWLVERLPLPELAKLFVLQGPYERQGFMITSYLRQVEHDEQRWSAKLWAVYEGQKAGRPIEECLDENIPASWDCYAYNERCVYYRICTKDEVFAAEPMASGFFRLRVPHHEAEKLQMFEDANVEGVTLPEELKKEWQEWLEKTHAGELEEKVEGEA